MSTPPPGFAALVKAALEHLYDPAYLSTHPFVNTLLPKRLPAGVGPAQALRQKLLQSIGELKPELPLLAGVHQGRAYQILQLRYVEALPYHDVMVTLALSQTQYHREQRQALEAVSALLWVEAENRLLPESAAEAEPSAPPGPYAELTAASGPGGSLTDLNAVAQGLVEILSQIAGERGVVLHQDLSARPALLLGNRTAIRQLIISLVGYVLAGAHGGQLELSSRKLDGSVVFSVVYDGHLSLAERQLPEARERLAVAEQLLGSLCGALKVGRTPNGLSMTVTFPVRHKSLLVVDDNPDMVQLITRFLADQDYTVLSAGDVREGLRLARDARPDVVVLDIMIPEQDGWDALQALKHDPATQDIPILVCSVLGESKLALALGAAGFIRKPLTLPALLEALARFAHSPAARAGENPGRFARTEAPGSPEALDR